MTSYSAFVVPCFGGGVGNTRQGCIIEFECKGTSERALKMAMRKVLNQMHDAHPCYAYRAPWSDLAVVYTESRYFNNLYMYVSGEPYIYQGFKEL